MRKACVAKAHEMAVEFRPIQSLAPYARNARKHSDEQIEQIAASIREFGWTNPVLVDGENGIIAGHGRVAAAYRLGYQEVPCIELGHLTESQKRAYIIADNKLAENAGWDEFLVSLEIGELADLGFDVDVIGFDAAELAEMLADDPQLKERTEKIEPVRWTRILISIPNTAAEPDNLSEVLDQVKALGGQVDYAGTNQKD